MRFWLALTLCLLAWPACGWSQNYPVPVQDFIPRQQLPIPSFGGSNYSNSYGNQYNQNQHQCYGPSPSPSYGYGYGGLGGYGSGSNFGYGYGPGAGFTFSNGSPFGFNYSGYSSASYGVPGFGVGYTAPLFGNTYYGPAWGFSGSNYQNNIVSSRPVFPTLPAIPQWMIDEANLDPHLPVKAAPVARTHRSLMRPSTREAILRGARLQDAGDRLMVALDYSAAERSYAKSIIAAPDRPEPYARIAVAKAARGDFRGAVSFLKQMVDVDPSYPGRADSLMTLFGHQNGIAKVQLKQHVADWTKIDVRDPDRIFLLGIMLFLDGDERFRTLLDTNVKIEGEKPYLKAFLDTTPAREVDTPAPTPDEIDALTAPQLPPAEPEQAPQPTPAKPLLLPTLPAP